MNTRLNNYGLAKLNNSELTKIKGGCRLCKAWKAAKWIWNTVTTLDALEQIQDGYQKCNDV